MVRAATPAATFRPSPGELFELPSGGGSVRIRPPGVLFELDLFGRFPDLGLHAGGGETPEPARNLHKNYEQSVILVCHSITEPLFSPLQTAPDGFISITEIVSGDFWELAAHCAALWRATRETEKKTVAPLSAAPAS